MKRGPTRYERSNPRDRHLLDLVWLSAHGWEPVSGTRDRDRWVHVVTMRDPLDSDGPRLCSFAEAVIRQRRRPSHRSTRSNTAAKAAREAK